MKVYSVSMTSEEDDQIIVRLADLRAYPTLQPVELRVRESNQLTLLTVRLSAEQLDRLILEATAAQRALDERKGVNA